MIVGGVVSAAVWGGLSFFFINRTAGYGTSCGAFSFRKTETAAVLCILVRFFFSSLFEVRGVEGCGVVRCGVVV